ncbi:MAG: hypothetical protein IJT38_00585 [Clostridia bacterium]|nr:hypothetical protein [Clostridia bacterium]
MFEDFCEFMVKRKKDAKDIIKIVLLILGGFLLTYLILTYGYMLIRTYAPVLISLIIPLIALVWYGVFKLAKKGNIEFEYALTSGDLDIDKIENKMRRRRLMSVHSRNIKLMAPVSDTEYNDNVKSLKTIDATSNSGDENVYFAVFDKDGQRQCLLFEPNQKIREVMHKYNPENIHIENK